MLPFVTSCVALVAITYGADTALLRTEELELLKPAMDCSKCWECFGCMDGGTRCMPIPGCVPSGCESNSDCGRGQKCENGQCSAATIHCVYDSDCLTEDHYCDNGVCELRRGTNGKSAGKSSGKGSGSKSGSRSRSNSRDRSSGGGHSGSASRSASAEIEGIEAFANHIGCVWDGSGCHNNLCDMNQMETRCQALSHDQDDCLGAEGINKRCVWKHSINDA